MPTVLITGSNRGVGLALAAQFQAQGWQVLATCREPAQAADLNALADKADLRILPLEVTSTASVATLAMTLAGATVDVLINNAGVMGGDHQSFNDMDYAAWLHTLEVNTLAPLRLCQALLPNLRSSANPRIVTLSSQMGAFGLDMGYGTYAYRSSKAAVSKVMQLLAAELRDQRIVVCPVHPGWVRTDMGGAEGHISAAQSAAGLYQLITDLTLAHSGRFWTWEGEEHVW